MDLPDFLHIVNIVKSHTFNLVILHKVPDLRAINVIRLTLDTQGLTQIILADAITVSTPFLHRAEIVAVMATTKRQLEWGLYTQDHSALIQKL